MKLGNKLGESLERAQLVIHLVKVAQEKMYVVVGLVRAPRNRLRCEFRERRVQGAHGDEFSVDHAFPYFADRDLSRRVRISNLKPRVDDDYLP